MAEASCEQLAGLIERWYGFWETADHSFTAWPQDPDGGELRLIAALHDVLVHTDHADVLELVRDRLSGDAEVSHEFESPSHECMFSGCVGTEIGPLNSVRLRFGAVGWACARHWDAIMRIIGEQAMR